MPASSRWHQRRLLLCISVVAVMTFVGCSASEPRTQQPLLPDRYAVGRAGPSPSPALLVTLPATSQIAFVDPSTLTIRSIVDVPGNPAFVTMNPMNAMAFASVNSGTGIQLIDTANQRVGAVIDVPSGFIRFAVAPDGDRIFAVNGSGTISVISVVHKNVLQTITVGAGTAGIAYSKKYHRIYASTPDTNAIAVFDADTFAPDKPIYGGICAPSPCRPEDLATSPDGSYLLAGDRMGIVLAMDARHGTILGRMTVSFRHNRDELFFATNPADSDIAMSDIGCCDETVWELPTAPPFTGQKTIGFGNLVTYIVGVTFDASGHAWGANRAYPPQLGRVVALPFKPGGKRLDLGQAPGGIAYAP